ncbi:MAG: hypothetical protein PHD29_07470 [bacterium]|nr:hypothetical protein [bacterium]MDD5353790.1 hypothetical protein [bacterium]MDD5757034.1 hypothetical protein [bacterium]
MKKVLMVIYFLCWGIWAGAAYIEPERKNREYELDLLTQAFPRSWEQTWQTSDNVLRVSGGSVNVRELLLTNQMKFMVPLADRLNLRGELSFSQTIDGTAITRNGFNRVDTFDQAAYKHVFEFEYIFSDYLAGSFLGAPTFEKQRTDLGLGLKWVRPHTYVKVNYYWLNFDNNYAYSKEKEFAEIEEIYDKNPREIQVYARYDNKVLSTYLELVLTPSASKFFTFYDNLDNWYRQETRSEYYKQVVEYKINAKFKLGAELFRETGIQDREFIPSRQSENSHSYFSKYYYGPYLDYSLDPRTLVSLELRYQRKYFVQDFHQAQINNYCYRKKEIFPVISYQRQIGKFWKLELSYLREAAKVSRIYPAMPELNDYKDTLVDDRLKIGFSYKINGKLELKAMTGVELDRRDQGRFPYLDKGAVQFISTF